MKTRARNFFVVPQSQIIDGILMILDVDGKQIQEPGEGDIARAFTAIDRWTASRSSELSLVTLSKDGENSLTASGHPSEGWIALLHETDGITRGANPSKPLSQEEAARIFQAYARGDVSWENQFEWNIVEGKLPMKRIAILIVALIGTLILARACAK